MRDVVLESVIDLADVYAEGVLHGYNGTGTDEENPYDDHERARIWRRGYDHGVWLFCDRELDAKEGVMQEYIVKVREMRRYEVIVRAESVQEAERVASDGDDGRQRATLDFRVEIEDVEEV